MDTTLLHADDVVDRDWEVSPPYGGSDVRGKVDAEDEEVSRGNSEGEQGNDPGQTSQYIRRKTRQTGLTASDTDGGSVAVLHRRQRKLRLRQHRTQPGHERHGQQGGFEAHGIAHWEDISTNLSGMKILLTLR